MKRTVRSRQATRSLVFGACLSLGASSCIIRTQADVDARAQAKEAERAAATAADTEDEPVFEGETGPAQPVRVTVDPAQRFQTLEGFGAAVAWYQDRIVGQTEEGTYETLFPELGLDILRFRNRFEREQEEADVSEEVEIFQRATKALGHPPKLFMSAWSPPASLKASGKEKCAGEAECTLKKENGEFVYQKFADWWRRSLVFYEDKGIPPDYISFQNEPDFIPPSWEGCKFTATETDEYPGYDKQLQVLHAELSKLPKRPKIWGPELLGIHYGRIQDYMAHLDQSLLDGMIHHIYERGTDDMWDWREPGPDSFKDEMQAAGKLTDLPILQTEFNTDEDKGIDGGFETAWLIHHTLVEEQAAGFLYWELFWTGMKGLAGMSGRKLKLRDHYYSMRHFSRYTDPGYVRVGTQTNQLEMLASAYVAPDDSRLTIVLLNTAPEAADVTVAMDAFPHKTARAFRTIFRPGESKRWREVDPAAGPMRMPEATALTLVLER